MAERKRLAYIVIFLVLVVFTATFFLLQVGSDWSAAWVIVFYCIIAVFSLVAVLVAALFSNASVKYFEDIKMVHVAVVLGAAALMFLISEVCASLLPATLQPLSSIPGQDSLATSVLSDILFTFTMVALAEELMKFVGYTEFKEYYKKLGNGKALLIALIPVALWAGFHAIQAYNNIWYVIPAFVDGMILIALLEYTKAFLAPVIAHGCYNAILILLGYVSTPAGLPFLPRIVTASDFFLIVLCLLWLLLGIVVPVYLSQKRCSF